MKKETYLHSMQLLAKWPGAAAVQMIIKSISVITAAFYAAAVLWTAYQKDIRCLRLVLVPAVSFLAVSWFRARLSAVRPYEKYAFIPLVPKDTAGKSFPSRHVFSGFIIAMAVLSVHVAAGVFLLFCSILLAVLRVMIGVHFPKDVIAGMLLGIGIGLFGFFIF